VTVATVPRSTSYILDTDCGSSDKGDFAAIANAIHKHRVGVINRLDPDRLEPWSNRWTRL